ncbi:hypothetical protein SRABI102_01579 [Stenotrophomonas lactitubi]|nr:hypothetical protein SRABI81_01322 [Stenotrophomonas lactitubi]CAH0175490.1 hypothetical protein SRABI122_01290 [Stenotrophomonas lactitubi]CAH0193626.1 hypothetical protein SRABI102_01579 [Stenotrophomonas lactitubi]CAH0228106.1 hypothetical protein SRABI66_02618 [Stenotrophomonas lactitubi]
MQRRKRPLWHLILAIYALGALAVGAGIGFGQRLFGQEC